MAGSAAVSAAAALRTTTAISKVSRPAGDALQADPLFRYLYKSRRTESSSTGPLTTPF